MNLLAPVNRTATRRSTGVPSRSHFKSLLSALCASAAFSMAGGSSIASADTACDAMPSGCCEQACGCDSCGCGVSLKCNPIYKTLDTVAGGIEKVLGLDRCKKGCCGAGGCDDACDSGEWLMPLESTHSHHGHSHAVPKAMPLKPVPMKATPASPRLPSVPPMESNPTAPRMTQPRIVSPNADRQLPPPAPSETEQPQTLKPRLPEMTKPRLVPSETPNDQSPIENPVLPKKDGSIFDQLDDLNDPFKSDTRVRRPYGSIRPTGLRSTTKLPSYRPVRPSKSTSRSSVESETAVGSGLRPARTVEPLRPVSFEAPIRPKATSSARVLKPYRPSR